MEEIDTALADSVGKLMCSEICPCVPIEYSKWDPVVSPGVLSDSKGPYRFNGTYTTFEACYNDHSAVITSSAVPESYFGLTKALETKFKCSGVCHAPLFYGWTDVTQGPPTGACIYELKAEFDKTVGVIGWVVAATALFLLSLFIMHYGMYKNDGESVGRVGGKKRFIFD